MHITFLGTSAGTPTKTRNVSACGLAGDNNKQWFLIDCGEGTQQQLLKAPLSLAKLTAIFITHVHGDHCYGLPGLLATAGLLGRQETLWIIAPKGVKEFMTSMVKHTDLYLPFTIEYISAEDLGEVFSYANIKVRSHALSHRVPSFAYQFSEQQGKVNLDEKKLHAHGLTPGPLWGAIKQGKTVTLENGQTIHGQDYLIHSTARSIVVAGDNNQPELLTEALSSAQVLIHEATYTSNIADQINPDAMHSYSAQVAQFAEQIKLRNLVLTHFSPRYSDSDNKAHTINEIAEEARRYFTGQLFMANDLAEYHLHPSGEFLLNSASKSVTTDD